MPKPDAESRFLTRLDAVLEELQLSLSDEARRKVLSHYRLLIQWNRRMSLTTVLEPDEAATRHFGESLFLARELPGTAQTALDVGSGAGFPGLPLAAWRADLSVTLLESVQRKAVFLREASRSWGNVAVRNERLETLTGAWDVSVMRAVALNALPDLARLTAHTAILTGEEGVEQALRTSFYEWRTPRAVPWGKRRFLIQGSKQPD